MSYVNLWDLNFRSFRIPNTCCESNFRLPCQVTGCLIAAVMCLYLITDFQWDLGPKARFSFFWLEVGAIEPDIIENKRGENEKKNTSNFIISKVKETSTNNKNLVHQSTSIVQHPFFPTKMVVHLLYIHSFIYCFFESFIYIYAFQYVRFQPTNPPQQAPFQAGGAYIMESTWLVLGGDPKLSKGDVL